MAEPYGVLFLCKHNASRSLMAEAILNKAGAGRFVAYSAGLEPSRHAHPYTLQVLEDEGFDVENLQPKSVQQFLGEDAPKIDMVIGLCQSVQEDSELDGLFPMTAHWHISDSDSVSADSEAEKEAFSHVLRQLSQRIHLLTSLPEAKLEHLAHPDMAE
ncbi:MULTISPECIES: arsenate reductase ArsC [unclassified Moraxella]|uniref:arsenate reductase/protein-tyrosine-phosphatase family protein n=1 Tax=unclassified Moraxella TaxID=2685852 RepID=UPI003AF416D6